MAMGGDSIADDAIVVRCGQPPFASSPLERACGNHPDGVFGFSVQAKVALGVQQLAAQCRNKSVGFTTVREVRIMGYDVVRTSGEGYHATVVVPVGWTAEAANLLARIFHHAANRTPKQRAH